MRREGFLESGLYLVLSAIFCALVCGACLLGGRVLSHYHLFLDFSPLAQLAIWENIFLNLCGWLLCVLFFNNDCWTFDSMGWPMSPVYAALFFRNADGDAQRQAMVLFAACAYAIRLNGNYFRAEKWGFIGLEDWRYVQIRKQLEARGWSWLIPSFLLVYIAQWLMIYLACAPIYYIMMDTSPINMRDVAFCALTLGGVLLEFFADSQLQNFIAYDKKPGAILDTGLWALSRHPNYLGQCVVWLGFGLWGYMSGSGVLVFVGSCNILGLIVFYSIDAMEERMTDVPSRRPAFEHYQKSTSRLMLWPQSHKYKSAKH